MKNSNVFNCTYVNDCQITIFAIYVLDIKLYFMIVTTLLKNLKGPVDLGNPNTCAEAKLCLFYAGFRNSLLHDQSF